MYIIPLHAKLVWGNIEMYLRSSFFHTKITHCLQVIEFFSNVGQGPFVLYSQYMSRNQAIGSDCTDPLIPEYSGLISRKVKL